MFVSRIFQKNSRFVHHEAQRIMITFDALNNDGPPLQNQSLKWSKLSIITKLSWDFWNTFFWIIQQALFDAEVCQICPHHRW